MIIAVPIEKAGAVIARIDGAAINELFDSIELSPQVVISVVDSEGRVLYRRRGSEAVTDADVNWAPLSSVLTNEQTNVVELTSPIDGIRRVYGLAHVGETGLSPDRNSQLDFVRAGAPAFDSLWLIGLIALLLAIGAALVIERSIVLPVRRLRSTAQRFGGGDLSARAPRSGGGEIGDLGAAFNTMATQIAEREERLNELDH